MLGWFMATCVAVVMGFECILKKSDSKTQCQTDSKSLHEATTKIIISNVEKDSTFLFLS